MLRDFDDVASSVMDYLRRGKCVTKSFRFSPHDVELAVDFDRSRWSKGVGVSFRAYHRGISEITSELYGRQVDYSIVTTRFEKTAANGKRIPFGIDEFSAEEKDLFAVEFSPQWHAFVSANASLDQIYSHLSHVEGKSKKYELPTIYFHLTLITFVAGKNWEYFLNEAKAMSSGGFGETPSKLETLLRK